MPVYRPMTICPGRRTLTWSPAAGRSIATFANVLNVPAVNSPSAFLRSETIAVTSSSVICSAVAENCSALFAYFMTDATTTSDGSVVHRCRRLLALRNISLNA